MNSDQRGEAYCDHNNLIIIVKSSMITRSRARQAASATEEEKKAQASKPADQQATTRQKGRLRAKPGKEKVEASSKKIAEEKKEDKGWVGRLRDKPLAGKEQEP